MDDNRGQMRLGVVWRRVGFTDDALRRWLLRFGEVDFKHAEPDARTQLREELTAFLELSRMPESAGSESKRARRGLAAKRRERFALWPSPSVEGGSATSEKLALRANRWIRELLSNVSQDETTRFTPRISYALGRVRHPQGWALTHSAKGKTEFDSFQSYSYQAFASWTHGLRACARCSRIFVPRGRQTFCSQRCAETDRKARYRDRKARWRKEHPEEAKASARESAHDSYERWAKKKFGARRVIARRPRIKK